MIGFIVCISPSVFLPLFGEVHMENSSFSKEYPKP